MKSLFIGIIIITLLITGCGLMSVEAESARSEEAQLPQPSVQRDAPEEVPVSQFAR